ncbi:MULTISPECIES: hypothetical protein [Sorangium]|nr:MULTISPECIES: hypothetical protein [Sorangium]
MAKTTLPRTETTPRMAKTTLPRTETALRMAKTTPRMAKTTLKNQALDADLRCITSTRSAVPRLLRDPPCSMVLSFEPEGGKGGVMSMIFCFLPSPAGIVGPPMK